MLRSVHLFVHRFPEMTRSAVDMPQSNCHRRRHTVSPRDASRTISFRTCSVCRPRCGRSDSECHIRTCGNWQDYQTTSAHTRPCNANKSNSRLVDCHILHGMIETSTRSTTNSAAISTTYPWRLCGDKLHGRRHSRATLRSGPTMR